MKQKKRSEIRVEDTWDLTIIYKNIDEFNEELNLFKERVKEFNKYKGRLLESGKTLLEFLELSDELEKILYKLYYYANLNFDVDTTNDNMRELVGKVSSLLTLYSESLAFVEPELLSGDYKTIEKFYEEEPNLKKYKFNLENIFRYKKHTLSENEEKLLSTLGEALSASGQTYESLTDSDLTFGNIKDENGETHEFTESNYPIFIESKSRNVRRKAFNLLFKTYSKYSHTIADTFRFNVEANTKLAKIRNYNSSIEASLYSDNISLDVYNNLIKTVREGLPVLYDYFDLKKEVLGLDEFHLYDVYASMVDEVDKNYTFEEAKDIVLEALSVLGNDYNKKLNRAFDERFIDIYNNKGKRGGAYSSSFYMRPYLLLNFEGKYGDVTTLAHELGHSMHSLYSTEANPYNTSSYKIFVAEVASTVNELLLVKYLIKKSTRKEEKLFLINKLLELFKGTIFRQTMFAEFEKKMYEEHEKGTILTSEYMNTNYYKLVKDYFGPHVKCDKLIECEWMRIPHFFYGFYVYKYAIGLSAASKIVHDIETKGESAVKKYIDFLKTGGSMHPADELLVCDVDISNPKFIEDAIEFFKEMIEEFREIYRK